MRLGAALLLSLLVAIGLWAATAMLTSAPEPVVEWVRANARPFDTTDPNANPADLAALDSIVGDAHFVGLGECTHGSHEVFQMKHRIVEYLATHKGFTRFAIEANMPEADRVNDYVLGGKGEPHELIRGMYFWTWQTQEVVALVEWMRAFNASGQGPIQFLGFDMQTPDTAAAIVRRFVAQVEPSYVDTLDATWRTIIRSRARPAGRRERAEIELAKAAAARTVTHLALHRDDFRFATRDSEFLRALQNARIIEQATNMVTTSGGVSPFVRDSCMAANVESIHDGSPRERIVLWAHNSHVSRQPGYMGDHLDRSHGGDYVVIGFTTARGTYRALDASVREGNILTSPAPSSLENALARAGPPRFLLDLRRAKGEKDVAEWLARYRPMRGIGARATLEQFRHTRVGKWYDAIVWIDSTSSAIPMSGSTP